MPMTRTELRRAIGDRLGLMHVLEATAAGTASTFKDAVRLGEWGDDAPTAIRRTLYFSGGTIANLGHEARTTDYASATHTLTFAPPADAPTAEGDEAELWTVSQQVTVSRIHRLLNTAIRGVERVAAVEAWSEPAVFDVRNPVLTIPEHWVQFGGGTYLGPTGITIPLQSSWWQIRPGQREAELTGRGRGMASRHAVTLFGYAPAPQLTTDSHTTEVDPQWLIESVLSAVRISMTSNATDPAAAERLGGFFDQNAKLYRRSLRTARRGLGIDL